MQPSRPSYTFSPTRGRKGQIYWAARHRNGKSVTIGGEGKRRPGEALTGLKRLLDAIARGDYEIVWPTGRAMPRVSSARSKKRRA